MNLLKEGWFSEVNDMWPGYCQSLQVKEVLYEGQSPFQNIKVLETTHHGKALILDDVIQCTERDEFSYQEMISFLPLCAHPNPAKVLIVGGGDGGVARECHKHPLVQQIVQVEIDDNVIKVCKRHLPSMAQGLDSAKLTLNIGDGFKYLEEHKNEFDVIITDSTDPVGPAASLFTEPYFKLLKGGLRKGGMICSQAGSIWIDLHVLKPMIEQCKEHFAVVRYATASVPTYTMGQIGFLVACLDEVDVTEPKYKFGKEELKEMRLKYYNAEVHRASFALPNFVKDGI